MHQEMTIAIARLRNAERAHAARLGRRGRLGHSRPVKAVRRALGR